jgi:alpha-L-rhamnosidase
LFLTAEEIEWEPKFTYHGFRYIQVSGLREKPASDDITGKVIYTDQPFIGKFESSNDLINNINKNVVWAQKGNFYPAPTDCPQRDERLGWMGDAQIFAPTANFNMHLDRYWSKWMFDITDGQDEEGWVYDVNPPIVVGGPSKPGWGDAVVIIPWLNYRYYGNKRIIEDNYEGMKAWVEYMRRNSENNIYFWEENGWYGYGDWIAVEPSPGKPIGSAYYFYSTKLLSEMAEVIGRTNDAQEYEELSQQIAEAFHNEYWESDSLSYPGGTQTANLLPLAFGLTPAELEDQVVKNLVSKVMEKDVHPTTGFLGTGYILPMLSKYNHHDLAYEMMNQTDYPSWGYMVKQGATTIWELWNSDVEPPEGMNSRNHFALGCVGEWIWNTLAGINISDEQPGFKQAIIKPQPAGDLKWVKAEYETNYGLLAVDWKLENNVFTLHLTVPPNTTALVELPGVEEGSVIKEGGKQIGSESIEGITNTDSGEILAAAGSYVFTVE